MRRLVFAFVLALLGTALAAAPAYAGTLMPVVPPSVSGTAEYAATLTADPGQWAPGATTYTYQWLRDGQPIAKGTAPTYRPGLDDLGHALSVAVTADDGVGDTGAATSAATAPVHKATLRAKGGLGVTGVARYTHSLRAHPG